MDFNGIEDYLEKLKGKEITVVFSAGDKITGKLVATLPDALVLSAGEAIALCAASYAIMICEGKFGSE